MFRYTTVTLRNVILLWGSQIVKIHGAILQKMYIVQIYGIWKFSLFAEFKAFTISNDDVIKWKKLKPGYFFIYLSGSHTPKSCAAVYFCGSEIMSLVHFNECGGQ